MKRLGATVTLFVFCASFVPLLTDPGTVDAKSRAKARTAKVTKPVVIPIPDRNPVRSAATLPSSGALPSDAPAKSTEAQVPNEVSGTQEAALTTDITSDVTGAVREAKLTPAPAADPGAAETDAAESGDAAPVPERNPERPTESLAVKGPVAAAPVPTRAPKLDFASILKPLLDYQLSSADAANLQNAFRASFRGDDAGAHAATERIKDTAASKLATWFEYRNGDLDASATAIEVFRLANPDWPGQDELRERAEIALFLADPSADKIRAFFSGNAPRTGAGKAALASAYLKDGNEAAGRELIVSAWRDYQLNRTVENKILARYGSMLTAEDHQARIDKLLFPDSKSSADAALRISKLLPAADQKKIAARVAVVKRGANAGKLLDAIPASAKDGDVGFLYNRIQWLRRKDRDKEAWQAVLNAPREPDRLIDAEGWWSERRLNCRTALNGGQPRIAYQIASEHGPISGDAYVEAEFLAGWIALRFLSEPKTALPHFIALRAAAKGSKNLALAEYWLGRTALALGDKGSAVVHFQAAAKFPQYFYGQLGRQALDSRPANLAVTPTPPPTQADIDSFMANDAVRAIGVARASDMERVTPQFFLALSRRLTSPGEVVLLAELAKASGDRQIALRLSKIAFNRDIAVGDYALPIDVLPSFKSLLSDRVEPALVHALSRQESEFNAGAKSPVGASGLMQLMPGTAKAVARQYKVKFAAAQLTNPTYNIQLGEAHLRELIDSYSGSYFMALAAYNAGGGRVQEWSRSFGDPRDPKVDPVDWIESIPFTETREYVKKIMETLQLYRSRLQGSDHALQLVQDLNRGKRKPKPLTQARSE
jgi:peptidoglycan lytic transglycosylase